MAVDQLSATFAALSDPTRRAILARLAEGEATVNELAEPFPITVQAVSKHLKVLERAGLIARGRSAQLRPSRLQGAALKEAADWLAGYRSFWEHRFDRLDEHLRAVQARDKTGERTKGMTEAITAHEITIRRVLDAPREAVWDAWTRPEQLAAWWGPSGWSTPPQNVEIDLRPGGILRVRSVSDEDGSEMPTVGTFSEVVEPERLTFEEGPEDAWHEGATSTVTFTDLGDGRTEMVLRSTIHTTDEMIVHAEAGMNGAVDRLAELLR